MAILSDGFSDSSVELLSSVIENLQNIDERTSMSLFQYTKRSMINSRVFITDNLMSEEILNPLMLNTMNLYVGLILTALSMNQYISDTKKVRDLISTVATESFDKVPDDLPKYTSELLDTYFGQLEATQPSIPSSNDTDDAINNQTECPYEGEDLPEDISSSEMSIVGKIISFPIKLRRLFDNNKTFYYVIMKIDSLKNKTVKLKGISVYKFEDKKRKTVGKLTDLNTKKWEIKKRSDLDKLYKEIENHCKHSKYGDHDVYISGYDTVKYQFDKKFDEEEEKKKKGNESFDDGLYSQDRNKYRFGMEDLATAVAPEPRTPVNLPSGRIIQMQFTSAGYRKPITMNLLLQLSPKFIPAIVADQFIALNFTPSFSQRWLQMKTGEISFFRDFIMGLDLQKKRRKALKNDKDGALKDMLEHKDNSVFNSWLKLAFVTPDKQNIANTILIFEKSIFDKSCSNAGLKFTNYSSRQKFFGQTMSMMIHVVDTMFNKVYTYYNGLSAVSEFTFDQIKRNSRMENVDLMQIMKNYAQGMAPKF